MDSLNNNAWQGPGSKAQTSSGQMFTKRRTSLGASQTSGAPTFKRPGQKKNSTFANQDSLPKLPIPDLESSCKKYVDALYPLQLPSERQETQAAVEDFLKKEGPALQEKLKEYASSQTSYIEQFCALFLWEFSSSHKL